MDILNPHCAGLDIHRDTIVACVRLAEDGGVVRLVETFATTTSALEQLSEWLASHGVTCVAMEATGGTGSRSGPCWRRPSNWFWPTPTTSRPCRAARPT
jgi:hypothetical protein